MHKVKQTQEMVYMVFTGMNIIKLYSKMALKQKYEQKVLQTWQKILFKKLTV